MQFLRRGKNVEARLQAVTEKLAALRGQVENKKRALSESKDTLASRLGDLALNGDSEQSQQAVTHARKSVERMEQGLSDLFVMIQALEKEAAKLEVERAEAVVRESVERLREDCAAFNLLLGAGLEAMQALRELHTKMWAAQRAFRTHEAERTEALRVLGRTEPLNLDVGFGALSADSIPVTHRYTVQIPLPNLLDKFALELIVYERKLASWANVPEHERNRPAPAMEKAAIGDMPAPYRGQGFKEVFDPAAKQ